MLSASVVAATGAPTVVPERVGRTCVTTAKNTVLALRAEKSDFRIPHRKNCGHLLVRRQMKVDN